LVWFCLSDYESALAIIKMIPNEISGGGSSVGAVRRLLHEATTQVRALAMIALV